MLKPFVYWAQDERTVFLKVDLMDVQDPDVNFKSNSLAFSCTGTGALGNNNYNFSLIFYDNIIINGSRLKLFAKYATLTISKEKPEWWPRLISQPQKPHWLKIDFDRWQSPDDLNDNEKVGNILEDHKDIFEKLQKEEIGYTKEDMRKVYLTCYSFFMYLGFLYICVVLLMKFLKDGSDFYPKAFETVSMPFYIMQSAQCLEIVHASLGLMKGGVLMPLLHITSRMVMLNLIIGDEPRVQTDPLVFYLFLVWTFIEIIRYPYDITQVFKKGNRRLTWLRYNAWIIFYPVGFACELVISYKKLKNFDESHNYSILMPNSLNFIFNTPFMLRIYMLFLFVPGTIALFSHMYRARRKKFGHSKSKAK